MAKLYGYALVSNTQGWDLYEEIRSDPRCGFASEPASLDAKWAIFARVKTASPKFWMDAYLAAFAVSGGYQLVSIDSGFRQFKGLTAIILQAGNSET